MIQTPSDFLKRLKAYGSSLREQVAALEGLPSRADSIKRRRKRAEKDFGYFCRTYFPHYLPTRHKSHFQEHVFANFCTWINTPGTRVALAAPRGSAKSTVVTQLGCLYAIVHNLHHMIMIIMDTETQAAEMLESIKAELDSNPRLKLDFPDSCGVGKHWKMLEIVSAGSIRVKIGSTLKRIRGVKHGPHRPSLVFLDDLENDENVRSLKQRDKLEAWLDSALEHIGPPDGSLSILYVGTLLHHDSVFKRTLDKAGWVGKVFASIRKWPRHMRLWEQWQALYQQDTSAATAFYQQNKKSMEKGAEVDWPGIRPLQKLMELRTKSIDAFDREQQNQPGKSNEQVEQIHHFTHSDLHKDWLYIGAVDPSLGKTKRSDPSAILLGAFDRSDSTLYLCQAHMDRISPSEQIERIIQLQRRYTAASWVVETVQFQHFYAQQLLQQSAACGVPVPVSSFEPKDAKDSRILSILPYINSGNIRFLPEQSSLLQQIKHWPETPHDDGIDALAMLWHHCMHLNLTPYFESIGKENTRWT